MFNTRGNVSACNLLERSRKHLPGCRARTHSNEFSFSLENFLSIIAFDSVDAAFQ